MLLDLTDCAFNIIKLSCYPQNGASSLHVAAIKGHGDVIQSLLQHKATVHIKRNVSVKLIFKMSKLVNINFVVHTFLKKLIS